MDAVRHEQAEMTWDSDSRLAFLTFAPGTRGTRELGAALVSELRRDVGSGGDPFGLLVDAANLVAVDAEFRAIWGSFFRDHRQDGYGALFNVSPVIRVATEMFALGIRVPVRPFADEADARGWLRSVGISA